MNKNLPVAMKFLIIHIFQFYNFKYENLKIRNIKSGRNELCRVGDGRNGYRYLGNDP